MEEELAEEDFSDMSALLKAGIYALLRRGEVVYIGKAIVLLRRLYTHANLAERKRRGTLTQSTPYNVKAIQFSEVWIFPCLPSDLDRNERRLIRKFQPKYNELLKEDREIVAPTRGDELLRELGMIKLSFGKIERRI